MNTMAEALKKANINASDFNNKLIDEKKIEADMQIEFLEKWLRLIQRNASEKEKHNFIIQYGYVSVQQFNLHMACMDDVYNLKEELEDIKFDISLSEIKKREKEIVEKEAMARNIKNITYYKLILRCTGKKDITPYGVDILKNKIIKV